MSGDEAKEEIEEHQGKVTLSLQKQFKIYNYCWFMYHMHPFINVDDARFGFIILLSLYVCENCLGI